MNKKQAINLAIRCIHRQIQPYAWQYFAVLRDFSLSGQIGKMQTRKDAKEYQKGLNAIDILRKELNG